MKGEIYVRLDQVSRKFGEEWALKEVSVQLERGKIYGIVGNNGSGKTVFMKCICGLLPATSGRIWVGGKEIGKEIDFPESLGEMASGEFPERFAMVSLDTDLYQPTLEGLSYFYPRLSPGGYMILDDYNSPQFPGVGRAVQEFCDREGVSVIPLCDLHGTAVLAKYGGVR